MRPFLFSLRTPRNPLAKFALGLMGVLLVGLTAVLGLVAGAALLLGLGAKRLFGGAKPVRSTAQPADPDVIEGEFSVVEKPRQTLGTN